MDDQKKPLLISILLFKILEHLLKSAATRKNEEGSYEETELLEYLIMVDQQNWTAIDNLNFVSDETDHISNPEEQLHEYREPW